MLLSAERSVLLLIDLQQRLLPAIHDGGSVISRAARLAEAALLLDVPVLATEQYPEGLSRTVESLAGYPQETLAKTAFSAAAAPGFPGLLPAGTREVVIAGVETHVCVLQTALDLLGPRHRVILVADAAGSRDPADHQAAVDRARQHGVEVVTSEMVLFEWLRDARHPRFREVHKLVK
jgi:nicotinamidase-related amidase